ncbi:MAG: hypothetical protein HOO67_02995 [Candidatus Peribacteraceae bacterium]|nr:hypothetical protein [Candidatus Peribacteraceae bacterium]
MNIDSRTTWENLSQSRSKRKHDEVRVSLELYRRKQRVVQGVLGASLEQFHQIDHLLEEHPVLKIMRFNSQDPPRILRCLLLYAGQQISWKKISQVTRTPMELMGQCLQDLAKKIRKEEGYSLEIEDNVSARLIVNPYPYADKSTAGWVQQNVKAD